MLKTVKSIVKNSAIYGIGNISSKLVGFILIPLYTKHLTVYDYGILSIIEITLQLLVSVIGLKVYSALLRWYWDKNYLRQQKSMFFTAFFFVLLITVSIILGSAVFTDKIAYLLFGETKYSDLILLMLLSAGLQINIQMIQTLMRIQEKPVLYSLSSLSRLIITLFCTIYFIVYLGRKVEGIYEAQIIGQVVFFLFTTWYIAKNFAFKIEWSILKEMLTYSFPLIFAEIAGVVFVITSRFCLKFLTNLEEVGVFSLGFKVANTIKVLVVTSVMLAITPIIYKKMDDPDNKRFYSKIMTYFCFGIMFFVLGLSILGKESIKFLAQNHDYWDAYKIIPILSFSVLFAMLKDISLTGLHITKKTKVIAGLIIIMSLINVALNIIFIQVLASIGAALATLVAQILFFLVVYQYAQKYYPIPYEITKIMKMILVSIILYLLSTLTDPFSLIYRLTIKCVLILLFPIVLYFWNFYEEIELLRLTQSWKKWRNINNWKNIRLK